MIAVTDIFGQKVCFVDEASGLVEVKNHGFYYSIILVQGQSFRIENDRSLTVVTRTDTAFTTISCSITHAA